MVKRINARRPDVSVKCLPGCRPLQSYGRTGRSILDPALGVSWWGHEPDTGEAIAKGSGWCSLKHAVVQPGLED